MRKLRLLQGAAALAIAATSSAAFAADHLDGPAPTKDPPADITDTYAWVEADKVLLVMDVAPLATKDSKFSDAILYALHVDSMETYGAKATTSVDIICSFDTKQVVSCWVGDKKAYVTGDASASDGIKSDDGALHVFTGLRADPFFFNLDGFKDTVTTVDAAAASLKFDSSGCPGVDAATSGVLVGMLQGTMQGKMPAKNFFEAANVLSIVLEVDKKLLTGGGNILAIWGSTNKAG
jgi:hypothetical protein